MFAAENLRLGWRLATAGGLVLLVFAVIPAHAQVPAGTALPGTTRQEIAPRAPSTDRVAPDDGAVPEETTDGAAEIEPDTELRFRLNGVNLTGATVYQNEDFDPILSDFIGTEVTLGGLREIGNRIERQYREDGYVATRVIIPPQAIRDGVPTLEIYEGKIIHYEINGEIGDVKKLIARYLDNLLTDEPARWTELERYLLLARDLPGISLTGTLRSAGDATPGGVILVVDTARKPVDAFINMQNRNADPTGPWTVSLGISANSNTEYGERLGVVGLAGVQPFEQQSAYFVYEQALGDEGLRLKFSSTQGWSEPRDALKPLNLSTVTSIYTLSAEYPAIRSRRFSFWTRGGFEYADQRTSARGIELFDDQVRTFFSGFEGVWFAPLGGFTNFDLEFRQGLDHFGAPKRFSNSQLRSRNDAEMDFSILKGSLSHRQPIPPFFELYFEASGQVASKPLPTIEEWTLGELTVGRGFEPGAITGDSGYGFIFETRFTPPTLSDEAWWLDNIQFYAFLDYGRAYDRGNPTRSPSGYEDLMSGGFGTRFQVFETFVGDFYLAIPRTKALSTTSRKPHPTVNFTVTKFF